MKNQVLELTKELISRHSVTPSDDGCQTLIGDFLTAAGFTVEHLPFGDVSNLWATYGATPPLCVFAGHTDVVPTGSLQLWDSDPFTPTIRDGFLYGRGAADMKTSLAAMVVAAREFLDEYPQPNGSIGFLITSDEEGDAINGTTKVVEKLYAQGTPIDFAVVGEPSSDNLVGDVIRVGRRGSLSGTLKLTGTLGHVAYADLTPNPIHELIKTFHELVQREWDQGNDFFVPTTFQISNLNSGTGAHNVIPAELEVSFNFRFSTEQNSDSLRKVVETAVGNIHGDLAQKIDWKLSGEPFLSNQGRLTEAVVSAIREVVGIEPERSTSGGTSDARFLAPKGVETVELGPVNRTIHKINERVALDELEPLTQIYRKTLENLLL